MQHNEAGSVFDTRGPWTMYDTSHRRVLVHGIQHMWLCPWPYCRHVEYFQTLFEITYFVVWNFKLHSLTHPLTRSCLLCYFFIRSSVRFVLSLHHAGPAARCHCSTLAQALQLMHVFADFYNIWNISIVAVTLKSQTVCDCDRVYKESGCKIPHIFPFWILLVAAAENMTLCCSYGACLYRSQLLQL